ncbi:MAG: glycosyltransferase [Bacteroidales bacterium]|nr:glycosyltransferase [Bacteroidales bacterium]
MKIAVITDNFPRVSELFIATQVVGLIERGHEVDIYATGRSSEPMHPLLEQHRLLERTMFCPPCDSPWRLLRLLLRFGLHHPAALLPTLHAAMQSKREGGHFDRRPFWLGLSLPTRHYDVLHVHFGYNAPPIATLRRWGLLRKPRFVVTFHGCDFMPRIARPDQYNLLFQKADVLIHVTRFAVEQASRMGFPEEKMCIVPCGLNPALEQPLQRTPNADRPLRIAYVGRLVDLKKPLTFIEIIANLRQRDVICTATMIGDGPLMEACRTRVAERGVDSVITLAGACTSDRVQALLSESDLFLFPGGHDADGRAENQGCVAQEAQAMGLPVICTTAGGTHESVRNGHTGYVLDEGDTEGMVEIIIQLNSQRTVLTMMGHNAHRHAIELYSNRRIIPLLEQVYQKD